MDKHHPNFQSTLILKDVCENPNDLFKTQHDSFSTSSLLRVRRHSDIFLMGTKHFWLSFHSV